MIVIFYIKDKSIRTLLAKNVILSKHPEFELSSFKHLVNSILSKRQSLMFRKDTAMDQSVVQTQFSS